MKPGRLLQLAFCVAALSAGCETVGEPGSLALRSQTQELISGFKADPVPLPAPVQVSYRPHAPVPYEWLGVFQGGRGRLSGTIRHDKASADGVRQIIEVAAMDFENRGAVARIPLKLRQEMTIEQDGTVREIFKPLVEIADRNPIRNLPDSEWRSLRQGIIDSFTNPEQVVNGCVGVLRFPRLQVSMHQPMWPANTEEFFVRYYQCVVAAMRGGIAVPGAGDVRGLLTFGPDAMERGIRNAVQTRLSGTQLEIRMDVRVRGSVFERNNEFILVSGFGQFIDQGSGARIYIESLIDPFTGLNYKWRFAVEEVISRDRLPSKTLAALPQTAAYFADLPARTPDYVRANITRTLPQAGGPGSIAGVYRSSIDSVFTVRAGGRSGTGFLIAPQYIATSAHVVEPNNDVTVDGVHGARLLGRVTLHNAALDIAFIRLASSINEKPLKLAIDLPIVGIQVLAIGTALGKLEGTLTTGVVSSLRPVREVFFVQFDAAVNPGNSGGPLLNLNGEVIGMVTNRITFPGASGLSFAISSIDVRRVFEATSGQRLALR
ncbi:MAG: S1C family serine protease [Pseudomonadota bacterium]